MADRDATIRNLYGVIGFLEAIEKYFPRLAEMARYKIMTCSDAIELINKSPEVIRCKDCRYFLADRGECVRHHFVIHFSNGYWYCADGKRGDAD